MNETLLHEARAAIARGWALTPTLGDAGKKPIRNGWQSEEPLPLEILDDEIRRGRNMAVRAGAPSGVVVLDVDPGGIVPHEIPRTLTVKTPRGGRHHYFKRPATSERIPNKVGLWDHVDVRADGGAAILPGSRNFETGGTYEWEAGLTPDDVELAPMPVWLLAALFPPKKPKPAPVNVADRVPDTYLRRALEGEVERLASAQPGTRNDALNRAAGALGSLAHLGLTEDVARDALTAAAEATGTEGIEATFRSGWKHGVENPRVVESRPAPSRATTAPRAITAPTPAQCPPPAGDGAADDVVDADGVVYEGDGEADVPVGTLPWTDMGDWQAKAVQDIPRVLGNFYRDCLCILAGMPGTLKTYVSLVLAVSIVTGIEIIPGFVPERAGGVLLLLGEDGAIIVARRIRAICEQFQIDTALIDLAIAEGRLRFVCGDSVPLMASVAGDPVAALEFHDLEAVAMATPMLDLIVADPLTSWGGVRDENDSFLMGTFGSLCIRLATRTDCAVLLLHHLRKNSADGDLDALRGSSAMGGKIRWCAFMERLADKEIKDFEIDPDDARGFVKMRFVKRQYDSTTGPATFFASGIEGVPVPVNLRERLIARRYDAGVSAMAEYILKNESHLTLNEIVKGKGDFSEKLREHVNEKTDRKLAKEDFRLLVEHGIRLGILRIEEVPTGGCPRKEIRAIVSSPFNLAEFGDFDFRHIENDEIKGDFA